MMVSLAPAIQGIRRDPRLLRVPPVLSLVCVLVGLAWLLILPLDEYSRHTYVSENALLPGQVNTYFGGSEHTVFRAYRHEVAALHEKSPSEVAQTLGEIFASQGLKVGRQTYNYTSAGKSVFGENVYGVIQGPRADATEAMVLAAGWRNTDDVLNQSGVALVLTMARYFKRWSLWSKDIIIVIPTDSLHGPQAWVDAYHDQHDPATASPLPLKSGALQGALALDYPAGTGGHRFEQLHVLYDGVNGQLPNLDLLNTVVHIATNQVGISCCIQHMHQHTDSYADRLRTVLRGMLSQGLGAATGPHSAFMKYHVDAITLQAVGDGWQDEMSFGRVVESSFRSVNNLLEHLHQSFFFYVLLRAERFVSIGTYLPSAMLVAMNFTIASIFLWWRSGKPSEVDGDSRGEKIGGGDEKKEQEQKKGKEEMEVVKHNDMVALVPKTLLATEERRLFVPVAFVCTAHILGLVPFHLFNHATEESMQQTYLAFTLLSSLLPYLFALPLCHRHTQELTLSSCLSLLTLGICLATLSTLNFSLGLITGLLSTPLSFAHLPLTFRESSSSNPHPGSRKHAVLAPATTMAILHLVSPPALLLAAGAWYRGGGGGVAEALRGVGEILVKASFAWSVSGTYTAVVVWIVWWPAWFVGATVVACALLGG